MADIDYPPVVLHEDEPLPGGPFEHDDNLTPEQRQEMVDAMQAIVPGGRFISRDGNLGREPFIVLTQGGRYFYARCRSTSLEHVRLAARDLVAYLDTPVP